LENSATKDESAMIDINPTQTSFSLKGNLADRLFTCEFDEKMFFWCDCLGEDARIAQKRTIVDN